MPGVAGPPSRPAPPSPTGLSGNIVDRGKGWQYQVGASMYGGPTDPSSGTHGYHGDNLVGTHAFAELGMGTALGNLPYGQSLIISYNGKGVNAVKLDIGLGGSDVSGKPRRIDLWYETAAALGFSGTGIVTIMKPDGSKMNLPGGTQAPVTGNPNNPYNVVKSGIDGIGQALADIGKVFAFLFSTQFLYIAAGIPVILFGLFMIYKSQGGPVPRVVPV